MKNLSLHQMNKEHEQGWLIDSDKSTFFKPNNIVECETVTCSFVTKNSEIATLQAKKSIINRGQQTVFLQGKVIGAFKGMNVQTYDVNYAFSSHHISTSQIAHFSHPQFQLMAAKSFIDLKSKKMILDGGVSSQFEASNSPARNNGSN